MLLKVIQVSPVFFLSLLTSWWIFGLFPVWGYHKKSSCEHTCASLCVDLCFHFSWENTRNGIADSFNAMLCYAKSLQSCLTLCDPIDGSPSGLPIPGILQARTLEWVAISFSNAWKWKEKVKSLSRVWLLASPWTAAYQAPPSMGFSRQEYWSGLPLPSPDSFNRYYYYYHLLYADESLKLREVKQPAWAHSLAEIQSQVWPVCQVAIHRKQVFIELKVLPWSVISVAMCTWPEFICTQCIAWHGAQVAEHSMYTGTKGTPRGHFSADFWKPKWQSCRVFVCCRRCLPGFSIVKLLFPLCNQ